MDLSSLHLLHLLRLHFPSLLSAALLGDGQLTLRLRNGAPLLLLLRFLHLHGGCRFRSLLDLHCTDWLSRRPFRFEIGYHLLSYGHNLRLQLLLPLPPGEPVPSVTPLFPSAGWLEREVWDLFGVFFTGHGDLRRILTDYGFEGFPLRKDFPLSGFLELRYDDGSKKLSLEPLEFTQEYRYFDFLSPWERPTPP